MYGVCRLSQVGQMGNHEVFHVMACLCSIYDMDVHVRVHLRDSLTHYMYVHGLNARGLGALRTHSISMTASLALS